MAPVATSCFNISFIDDKSFHAEVDVTDQRAEAAMMKDSHGKALETPTRGKCFLLLDRLPPPLFQARRVARANGSFGFSTCFLIFAHAPIGRLFRAELTCAAQVFEMSKIQCHSNCL